MSESEQLCTCRVRTFPDELIEIEPGCPEHGHLLEDRLAQPGQSAQDDPMEDMDR